MFPLHESSRRQIAMLLFCLLCIMPTFGVVGWAITWRLPSHLAAERAAVAQTLGLDVTLSSMRHVRPGVVAYENLSVSDPENGKLILSFPSLQAEESIEIDHRGEEHPALVLQASKMTIDAQQWPKVHEALQRRLQGVVGGQELEIRFNVDEMVLQTGEQSQTLYRIEAGIGALPAGRQAGLQAQFACRLDNSETADKVRMRLVRNREISPPTNGFDIDTGHAELPCRLLAFACSELNTLGDKCRFNGWAMLYNTPKGLAGEVNGRLIDLDLATALGRNIDQNSGQSITGLAEVTLDQTVLRGGRLDAIAGKINVGPGTISHSFFQSAVDHLQLAATPLPAGAESVPFDALNAKFWLNQKGLSLVGDCPDVSTAMMTFGGRLMLGEPAMQPLPVGALVQVLSAGASDTVPATQKAVALAHCLPTPDGNMGFRPASLPTLH